MNYFQIMETSTEKETLSNTLKDSFDKLEEFPKKMNFCPLMVDIYNGLISNNSQQILNSIYLLRRIQKYEKKLFILLFKSMKYILIQLIQYDTYIKDILILFYELFFDEDDNIINHYSLLKSFIKGIITIINDKKKDDSPLIASLIMDSLITFSFNFELIEKICSLLSSSNRCVAEMSTQYIHSIINSSDFKAEIELVNWDFIFEQLTRMAIKNTNIDIAQRVFLEIKSIFTTEDWISILAEATNDNIYKLQLLDNFDIESVMKYKKERDQEENYSDISTEANLITISK